MLCPSSPGDIKIKSTRTSFGSKKFKPDLKVGGGDAYIEKSKRRRRSELNMCKKVILLLCLICQMVKV